MMLLRVGCAVVKGARPAPHMSPQLRGPGDRHQALPYRGRKCSACALPESMDNGWLAILCDDFSHDFRHSKTTGLAAWSYRDACREVGCISDPVSFERDAVLRFVENLSKWELYVSLCLVARACRIKRFKTGGGSGPHRRGMTWLDYYR